MNGIKKNKTYIILIFVFMISIMWLITKGLPWQQDVEFHYTRIVGLANSIKNHDYLALIHDTLYGHGYANGIFYSNFYLYIPAILCCFGMSYIHSIKLLYILINLATILIMFLVSKKFTKKDSIALIITVLYMFSSYRMLDIFVRGALGEMLAFMIIPLIILGIYEIIYGNYHKWYYFSIGFVLLLVAHLISTFLFAIFMIIIILVNLKRLLKNKKRINYLLLSGLVGIFIGAFALFPILEQYLIKAVAIFSSGSTYLPKDNAINIINLLIPSSYASVYIGIGIIFLLPIRLYINKNINKEDNNKLNFGDLLYILGIIAWLFISKIFPWHFIGKYCEFIQFPWRLLIISTSFLIFSYLIYLDILSKQQNKQILKYSFIVIIISSFLNIEFYSIQYGIRKNQYTTFDINEIGNGEYLPTGTNLDRLKNQTIKSNNNDIKINYNKKGTSITINYHNNLKNNTYIEIPLLNYKGYSSSEVKIKKGNNNLIRLSNLKERGKINLSYKGTKIQNYSYIISFISWIILLIYIILEKRKEYGFSKRIR